MEFRDYYQVLGVDRNAAADDIKRAYRKLARKYHPDVNKAADAEQRMKEVNEANAVLSDPERRAAYDQLGRGFHAGQEFRPPPDWDAGFEFTRGGPGGGPADFSEFFSSMFGQMGNTRGAHFHTRGEDHHAKVVIDLDDAFHGATREITLRAPQLGSDGRVATRERTLKVRIPKGVRNGQQIRLAGQGRPGPGGGPAGDLYLEMHFRPHPRYRVDGRDIHESVPVAPWEAALGATIEVPTPAGTVSVRVPPGSQNGRKLRLKGRGIPAAEPGDLYLVLEVVLPPADTDSAREFYERMARELPFNPRQGL